MTELLLSYFNLEHGGRKDADYFGNGGPFDFRGLAQILRGDQWPHILVMGEGDRYELNGREGAWEAAAAMQEAGGPMYFPHTCSLPREGGMFAPVIFTDPQAVVVRRFYDHRLPDFASRTRNLLVANLRGSTERFLIVAHHGDPHSGDARLADVRGWDRLAKPNIRCAILGDWNSVPSGPWEPTDLNKEGVHNAQQLAWRIDWEHGPAQAGPYKPDTRALDYLIGWWDPKQHRRIGGLGFRDAAEFAGDLTPTQIERPNGRQSLAFDRILVSPRWANAMVPGSYRVHLPADADHHESDHYRVSVAIRV